MKNRTVKSFCRVLATASAIAMIASVTPSIGVHAASSSDLASQLSEDNASVYDTLVAADVASKAGTTDTDTDNLVATSAYTLSNWSGAKLSKRAGSVYGPSGKETYYNLNMSLCVSYMRALGYSEEEYPYWVREDGVKMFGNYVMVAANLTTRPKGSLVATSLGTGIVVDTGVFAWTNPTQLDVATTW
ncbi:MAG TPA: hypothetical protein DGX96_10550 [Lachnospiraceae bacterium]|nr:hypothetical protein [Lachnospiraceae bacterium]